MEKASAAGASSPYAALENNPAPAMGTQTSEAYPDVPEYLKETYWWAYLHPTGVRVFERQWVVNMILWGNFARLRDDVLDTLGQTISGRVLQVACVYGDFSPSVAARLAPESRFDIIDVAQVQLDNVAKKIKDYGNVTLHRQDSSRLEFPDGTFDHVVVFFLLHEQPLEVRQKTVAEAMRVVKPGGRVIFTDYHRPDLFNPFRYVMAPILITLEPFAMDMWNNEITDWLPKGMPLQKIHKEVSFGGLYQKVVITR